MTCWAGCCHGNPSNSDAVVAIVLIVVAVVAAVAVVVVVVVVVIVAVPEVTMNCGFLSIFHC